MAANSFGRPLSSFVKPPTAFCFPRRRSRIKIAAFWALTRKGRTLLCSVHSFFNELFTARALALQISAYRAAFSAGRQKISKKVGKKQVSKRSEETPLSQKQGRHAAPGACEAHALIFKRTEFN